MWEIALFFTGLAIFLIGTGVWQALREQDQEPHSPKEVFCKLVSEDLGLDPKRLDASTLLLSGPLGHPCGPADTVELDVMGTLSPRSLNVLQALLHAG